MYCVLEPKPILNPLGDEVWVVEVVEAYHGTCAYLQSFDTELEAQEWKEMTEEQIKDSVEFGGI